MKEIKQQKRKRKTRKRIRRILLVLVILGIIAILIRCGSKPKVKEPDNTSQTVSLYEEQVDEIVEIDYSQQQEALNAIVEEGKMNVNYSSEAVFKGTVSEQFNVKNIKNNHYPIIFELYDEKGSCIYVSKQIKPGYEVSHIQLQQKISKGTHECTMKIGYAETGNVSSVFPITIEVK